MYAALPCYVFSVLRPQTLTATALVACEVLTAQTAVLVNPLLTTGPDPWVTHRSGFYYVMHTTGNSLMIRKTRSIADLANGENKVVWRAPAAGPYSRDVWAPEL